MAKQKVSLETLSQNNVKTASQEAVTTAKAEPKADTPRPHVSIYVSKAVQKVIKQIALDNDCRPHDLYVEAIDALLTKHGRLSVAELTEQAKA